MSLLSYSSPLYVHPLSTTLLLINNVVTTRAYIVRVPGCSVDVYNIIGVHIIRECVIVQAAAVRAADGSTCYVFV